MKVTFINSHIFGGHDLKVVRVDMETSKIDLSLVEAVGKVMLAKKATKTKNHSDRKRKTRKRK